MLALLVLGQVVFSPDGGGGALVRKLVCGGALVCSLEGGTGNMSASAGGSVPAACGAGEAVTSNGSALVCTATLTASSVAGANVSGPVASATLASTAESLTVDPANCTGSEFAIGISAAGAAQCATVTGAAVSGAVATASALAADPTACPGGQFVTDMTAAGVLSCATPAGGGSGTTVQVTGSNYANSTVTPSTVLSWAVSASTQYGFLCVLTAQGTTTSLPRFNITGPASTNISFRTRRMTSTSAQTLLVLQAFSASAQTAACTSACNATQLPIEIEGTFIVGASGGTVSLQAASSTAGQTVTVFRGSYCRVF